MLKIKHIVPKKCGFFVLCVLLFLIEIIAVSIKIIARRKIVIVKHQNRIMVGAFSIISTSPIYVLGKFKGSITVEPVMPDSPLDCRI